MSFYFYFRDVISLFLCYIRARANPFAGFQTGRGGMHEISPDELFNMFFNVRKFISYYNSYFVIYHSHWIFMYEVDENLWRFNQILDLIFVSYQLIYFFYPIIATLSICTIWYCYLLLFFSSSPYLQILLRF